MAPPLILSSQEASNMASTRRQTFDNVLVRPQIAADWLSTVNTRNRSYKPRAIQQYAKDMEAGNWTPSRIVFYANGELCDGQNRLAAVVLSEVTVAFDILVGAADIEGVNMDMGVKRKQGDSLKLQGAEHWITTNHTIAIINYIARMGEGNVQKLSHNEIKQYAEKNQEWIKPIAELPTAKKNLTTAAYAGSIALALRAGESLNEISEFHHAYLTGEVFDRNKNAALRLREHCLENKYCWTGQNTRNTGKLAQRALKAYIDRQHLSKLYVPSDWIYSLPKINQQ